MKHAVKQATDIVFAEAAGTELLLNLYRPDLSGPVPTVLYLHGGGWRRGDRLTDVESHILHVATEGGLG